MNWINWIRARCCLQAKIELRGHVRLGQQSDKSIGEIPFNEMVDYRVLEEVRREAAH